MAVANLKLDWKFLDEFKMLHQLNEIKNISKKDKLPIWNSLNQFYNKSISIRSVNRFTDIKLISWGEIDSFYDYCIAFSRKEKDEYLSLIEKSDQKLFQLGKDPLNFSWTDDFRPLRLSREEDWSDWLAFLIKRSDGRFIDNLFGLKKKAVMVRREYVAESARADIVIKWEGGHDGTHVEVKIGDPNLGKTHDTSISVRNTLNEITTWNDFILLLDYQIEDWKSAEKTNSDKGIEIKSKTWTDVAVAIRRCLYDESEDLLWRSLGYVFTGCIETKLYNAVCIEKLNSKKFFLGINNQINILRRSLEDGKN